MRRWNSKSFSLIETIFEKLPFSFKVRTSVLSAVQTLTHGLPKVWFEGSFTVPQQLQSVF